MTDLTELCDEFQNEQLNLMKLKGAIFGAVHKDDLQSLVTGIRERDAEIARLKARLRTTAQTLIETLLHEAVDL